MFGIAVHYHDTRQVLIPQSCLVAYTTCKGHAPETKVSRHLDKLPNKSVQQASPNKLQHFRAKGCINQTTTRLNLLTLHTAIRLAQSMKLPKRFITGLQAQSPAISSAPPASAAAAAADQAAGMNPAATAAAVANTLAAAATRGAAQEAAAAPPAAAIPDALPVGMPLVVLTDEELHISR